jgi:hypothetical protein
MKKLIFIIPFIFFACISESPKVKILNNTMITYDSIKVYSTPNVPTTFKNVEPKDRLAGRISFDVNNFSDGAYMIQIYNEGKIYRQNSFGYYTNGGSLSRKMKIVIEPDTLKFDLK